MGHNLEEYEELRGDDLSQNTLDVNVENSETVSHM